MGFIENPEILHEKESSRIKNVISQDQLSDAKLYSDRLTFIETLPKNISFLEVGTLGGDFAIDVIKKTSTSKAVLVDPYNIEDEFECQYKTKRWDSPKDHYPFVKNRFKDMPNVEVYAGTYKFFCINRSDTFDFIYIDYDHTLEETSYAIQQSVMRLNPGGIIGFNDFCNYGNAPIEKLFNGANKEIHLVYKMAVINAVTYFLEKNKDWYVYAFALNEEMTSDIYLKKR